MRRLALAIHAYPTNPPLKLSRMSFEQQERTEGISIVYEDRPHCALLRRLKAFDHASTGAGLCASRPRDELLKKPSHHDPVCTENVTYVQSFSSVLIIFDLETRSSSSFCSRPLATLSNSSSDLSLPLLLRSSSGPVHSSP
mmetsp:Transcript_1370/g.2136  ORF Transcript_1370/g.2136 Transcript_1370/m.2136 type:complete len:141 (-) Transcript_1370:579-1001(-)